MIHLLLPNKIASFRFLLI